MSAQLFSTPSRATDGNGIPLSGAKWYFYATGTITPQAVYADSALSTPLSNPVVADAGGKFAPIYLDSSKVYRAVLKDSAGATTISDIDPITVSDLSGTDGASRVGSASGATVQSYLNSLFNFTGSFSLHSLGGTSPANGVYHGAGGNSLSFQTRISNPSSGADTDNQRATTLIASTTSDDGNSEEQTLCVLTTAQTGYRPLWQASHAYVAGNNVQNGTEIYRCVTGGTSAGSGGPTGTGTSITDGTVVWTWINNQAIDAKLGIYNEVDAKPGAGSVWGQANNLQLESGYTGSFAVCTEFDMTNNCGTDSVLGGLAVYGAWVAMQGTNVSTSGVEVSSANTGNYATLWGLHLTGNKLASRAVIAVDSSAPIGLGFGLTGGGAVSGPTYTTGVIVDGSTSPKGVSMGGAYSSAAYEAVGTGAACFNAGGTYTIAAFQHVGTSPRGAILNGTYSKTPVQSSLLPNYVNDAAAAAGGLSVGDWYRNGSVLMQRVA